jgi:putative flippase GtrA
MPLRLEKYIGGAESTVHVAEFIRFLISGIVATAGNLAAVWCSRHFAPFEVSLVIGTATGAAISFLMSKFFAFQSRSWARTRGEAARFILVYCVGLAVYWPTSLALRPVLLSLNFRPPLADMVAVLVGASLMTLTSYFGHRFFTYRRTAGVG